MKYVKLLSLLAVAVAAVMAFSTSASADYLATTTDENTPPVNFETIHVTNEPNQEISIENAISQIKCQTATAQGKVETHTGGTSKDAATGKLTSLTFTNCTDSWHVTTTALGEIWVDWAVGHNGVIMGSGTKISATRFFVPCNYETNHTNIGTLTGGKPATLHIEGSIPLAVGSSELCGSGNAKWEGNYVTTSELYVVNGH
jgi:hypothetical protein